MIERVVGFDFGFGDIKIGDTNGNKLKFPTLDKIHLGDEIDPDQDYIAQLNDGQVYDVGEFAKINKQPKKWDKSQALDKERLSLFLGIGLFELSEKENDNPNNEVEYINLCVGLPLDYFKKQKAMLEEILKDLSIKIKIGEKTKTFVIKRNHVMKQAVGAFIALSVDINGELKEDINEDFFKYGGGLIDIGYKTLDILRIVKLNGKFVIASAESQSIDDSGIFIAHEKVKNTLNKKYNISHDEIYYEDKLFNGDGTFRYGKKNIELKPYFNEEYKNLSTDIKAKITATWKDLSDFGALFFTGGGAIPTKGMFDDLDIVVKVQDDCGFANVNGYIAKMMMILKAEEENK